MKRAKFERYMMDQFLSRASKRHVEVEQKYRIPDINKIRKKISKMKAVKGAFGPEHNELYDLEGLLRDQKHTLRLRYHGDYGSWLTMKGPRLGGRFKKRVEMETPVQYESMKRILHMLGYRIISIYRKQREEYIVSQGKICLDYLPKAGWFAEIEGTPRNIYILARKLGLEKKHHESRSYRRILKELTFA